MEVKNKIREFSELEKARLHGRAEALSFIKIVMNRDFGKVIDLTNTLAAVFPSCGNELRELMESIGNSSDNIIDGVAASMGIQMRLSASNNDSAVVLMSVDQKRFFESLERFSHVTI